MKEKLKTLLTYFGVYLFIAFLVANSRGILDDGLRITDWETGFGVATIIFVVGIIFKIGKDFGRMEQKEIMEIREKRLKEELTK